MSDSGGTDNPAFISEEESHENSCTESNREDQSSKSPDNNTSSQVANGNSFVSQHYVEPTRKDGDAQYKTETRIEVPGDTEKSQNPAKVNGVHANGNNDDASFLNNSVTSVQANDGKKEQIEAVNLELVSMRPYATGNNHQKGQEACDLPNDPYEEYFVPVNEHRKYIRGEKLYVTKDKRSKSSYWRRLACWGFGLSVVAVALIIAILAATGVILTQEATQPLDNSQQTYDGVKAAGSKEFIKNPPSSPPPETSSFTPWPTTDETIFKTVPQALNGIIWLDNLEWNDQLMDPKSRVYRDISAEIENTIRANFFSSTSVIKVYNISDEGEVRFRISYPPASTPEMMQESVEKTLQENGNMIGKYHLHRVEIESLLDECQYKNMNCSNGCKFDYMNSVFMCACPPGSILDATGNNCIDENDLSDVGMDNEQPKTTTIDDSGQGRSSDAASFFESRGHNHDHDHWMHDHDDHDHHEIHATVEPVGEPLSSPEAVPTHNVSTEAFPTEASPEPSPEPESEPQPSAESTSEPEATAEPNLSAESSSNPLPSIFDTEISTEPISEPIEDKSPASDPDSQPEPVSEPSAEPNPEVQPTSEPVVEAEPLPESKVVAEPTSEPISLNESAAKPVYEPISPDESTPEPVPESVTVVEPSPEVLTEATLVTESSAEPASVTEHASEPVSVSEPTAEPISESTSGSELIFEPEVTSEPVPSSEPTTKPTSEPSSEPTSIPILASEPTTEPKSEPEPTTEPTSNAEPSAEPVPKPASSVEFDSEPDSSTEPAPLPDFSPEPAVMSNYSPEPTSPPVSSTKPTLPPDSSTEPTSLPESFSEPTSLPESSPEPTSLPESSPEPTSSLESSSESILLPESLPEPSSEFHSSLEHASESTIFEEPLGVIPLEEDIATDIPKTMNILTTPIFENPAGRIPTTTPDPILLDSHYPPNEVILHSRVGGRTSIEAELEEVSPTSSLPLGNPSSPRNTPAAVVLNFAGITTDSPFETNRNIFPQLAENISKNIEPLNEAFDTTTSTESTTSTGIHKEIQNIHEIIPELTPEHVTHETPKKDADAMQSNGTGPPSHSEETIEFSTTHPLHPIILPQSFPEKPTEKTPATDEKHQEDMSPFLPDVVREKEMPKKAPRLDKDEQDLPNPFEPAVVEDVIIHHENHRNESEFTDLTNEVGQSHVVQQTGTTREEDVTIMDGVTIMPTVVNDTHTVDNNTETSLSFEDLGARQTGDTNDTNVSQVNDLSIKINGDIEATSTTTESADLPELSKVSSPENATLDTTTTEKSHELANKFDDNAVEDQYNDINDDTIPKDFKRKLKTGTTNEQIVDTKVIQHTLEAEIENTTAKNDSEIMPMIIDKQTNDETNKFTTEVPILPIEIQQDVSTTETGEKIGSTVSIVADADVGLLVTTTQASTLETKTTAQVPILPEELQTTEANDIMSTTEQMAVISNDKSTTPTITEEISEQITTDSSDVKSTTETIVMTASDSTQPIADEMHNDEDNKTTTETVTQPTVDIKPVSEVIVDDPQPVTFDRSRFFTTTTEQALMEEIPEHLLRVIPLEAGDEFVGTTIVPELPEQQQPETDTVSTTEETPSVSKLKIIEITSDNDNSKKNASMLQSPIESPKMEMPVTPTSRTTPEIIPVYEEVEDDSMNPFVINPSKRIPVLTTTDNPKIEVSPLGPSPTVLFSKCNAGQFQCLNGTSRDGAYCVDLSSKCDSENDCSDGSDEINCQRDGCPGNFQCASGQCLKRHLVCNGIVDCDDGSDENKCNDWTCHFDEFQCPNGRCIPDLWRCNGRPDCDDHKDEYYCSESCENNEYLCPTEKWCIPQTLRCNGGSDCANGEDEKLCDCTVDQFKCRTGGCINSDQLCDGIEHCPDRSDEWDCLAGNLTLDKAQSEDREQPTTLKITMGNERLTVCSDDWSKSHSDEYCKSLGFAGSDATVTAVYTEGPVLALKTSTADSNLITNLVKRDSCGSGEIVKVSCQEFTCGSQQSEGPTARLVGGTPAGEGQWSSVALLREVKSGASCTASVLGPMHALASYSCIYKHRQSPNWELNTGRDLQQSTRVKNIVPYPEVKYNQFLYENDFALIELSEPLVFSINVSAVCLPSQQFQPRALCVTAGWGFPMIGDVNLKLNFLPIPTYDTNECNATSHYAGFIKENYICAGFTGADKGTCYNDEGAPLMCATETERWEIQGLLSHHSRCSRGYPAIYSSLTPIISWLRHSIPALQTRV
ncbi:uncharacterized protein [Fopius arisanus]|uniref:Uncharacterized protein n=2 Tax=Fopius arisanus TaxID=64838 RepID=A0A9R1U6X0_9HYME|nr:PREDICTED: uncharacterized protein LOC105270330 [Fopius arisanus]XP_011309491.1 PREDICTED: uncharacterized protein LOC105270330 [Fopius arisanus]XP_011309492.1 PREDICTED: uncharacterized protein LOC105270330 [Fopius arisanus]